MNQNFVKLKQAMMQTKDKVINEQANEIDILKKQLKEAKEEDKKA